MLPSRLTACVSEDEARIESEQVEGDTRKSLVLSSGHCDGVQVESERRKHHHH